MSGICGLFNLDDAPVTEAELRAMTAMLEKRGPDGTGRWYDGLVGFGHTMLATTPESLHEPQPFRHAESGCVITADVRLDYRDELIKLLALEHREFIGDAELIVESYLKWGEACLDRLYGDFAFAVRDPRNNTLFLARDRFGARPLYYHYSREERFVFASDPRAILVLPQVPYAINEGRIADFIVRELEWIDYTSTFYKGILRLPPAHKLTISSTGLRVAEYWDPQPGPELGFTTDDDYRDGFLEVFSRAVEERVRVPGLNVGSTLSGGMDSGSIVAVANEVLNERAQQPLRTYSLARPRGSDCLESHRIYATLDHLGLSGTQIMTDEADSVIEKLDADLAEPFDGQMLFLKAIYEAARNDGVKVVLDGAVGDIVFNAGTYIRRLLRSGRIRQAWQEIVGRQAYWGLPPSASSLVRHLGGALAPEVAKALLRGPRRRNQERGFIKASLISPEFAERINIEGRLERMRETDSGLQSKDPALERIRKIRPCLTAGRERYARIAASAGVEGRDPFTDQRVVNFCSRLPDSQVARYGWPKFLLRKAMRGRLPDEVRWGREKPHIGYYLSENYIRLKKLRSELSLDRLLASLTNYVDPTALRAAWSEFDSGEHGEDILTAHILALWLENTVTRPVVKGEKFG